MTEYTATAEGLTPAQLAGFFDGWPAPPSAEMHLRILTGSSHVVLAWDGDRVVGFVTAISDGVLSAYLPLLEVLPGYQGRGIGSELVRRVLAAIGPLYMVDVTCDVEVQPFYARHGLVPFTAAMLRNRAALRSAE